MKATRPKPLATVLAATALLVLELQQLAVATERTGHTTAGSASHSQRTKSPPSSSIYSIDKRQDQHESRHHNRGESSPPRTEQHLPGLLGYGQAETGPSFSEHGAIGQHGNDTADGMFQDKSAAAGTALSFTSCNGYPKITWSPWIRLAEPYREATLRADSTAGDPDNDVFLWSLPGENDAVFEGREIQHTFKTVGKKAITLTQTITATGKQIRLETYITVKYVRREIRQLNTEDREAFFDAMEILYRLPTAAGVHQYGSEYKGIDFFVQMHLDGAGVKDCDHWHDDAGIMTHHVGYTLQFEQALQLVNPSVSIPYWEYTIEYAEELNSYGDSVVFGDEWFGEFSPNNALHTVTRGRWAYLPVMKDAWDYVHNPYGLLRSPWNLDSTPYVTRFNTTNGMPATSDAMVSCSTYSDCFGSTSLKGMNACLNGQTHGPVHILIGGEWLAAEEDFVQKVGYYESLPLVAKFLWRKGYLRIPEACTEGGDKCITSCPSHLYESRGMTPYDVLMDVHALMWLTHTTDGTLVYSSEDDRFVVAGHENDEPFLQVFWTKMLDSFCNPGHVGEMYTSAAPYDPLFWVVHPTSDRLLGWRRMLGRSGADEWEFDETWGYRHATVVGESGTVCDWSHVQAGTSDMPTCILGVCGGHNKNDLLPFDVKIGDRTMKLTNVEWLDLIYPTNEDLPYMYDSFQWTHCSSAGTFGV